MMNKKTKIYWSQFLLISSLSFFGSMYISGCSVYRMEVQQGNALSQETVSQLQNGMSKAEVITLLGNPLLQDSFNQDRWDYIYFVNDSGKISKKKNLTLIFKNDQLLQVK